VLTGRFIDLSMRSNRGKRELSSTAY